LHLELVIRAAGCHARARGRCPPRACSFCPAALSLARSLSSVEAVLSSITSLVEAMAATAPLVADVGPQGGNEEEVVNEASFRRGDVEVAMVAVGVYTKTELKAAKLKKLPDLEPVKAGLVKVEVTGKRDAVLKKLVNCLRLKVPDDAYALIKAEHGEVDLEVLRVALDGVGFVVQPPEWAKENAVTASGPAVLAGNNLGPFALDEAVRFVYSLVAHAPTVVEVRAAAAGLKGQYANLERMFKLGAAKASAQRLAAATGAGAAASSSAAAAGAASAEAAAGAGAAGRRKRDESEDEVVKLREEQSPAKRGHGGESLGSGVVLGCGVTVPFMTKSVRMMMDRIADGMMFGRRAMAVSGLVSYLGAQGATRAASAAALALDVQARTADGRLDLDGNRWFSSRDVVAVLGAGFWAQFTCSEEAADPARYAELLGGVAASAITSLGGVTNLHFTALLPRIPELGFHLVDGGWVATGDRLGPYLATMQPHEVDALLAGVVAEVKQAGDLCLRSRGWRRC